MILAFLKAYWQQILLVAIAGALVWWVQDLRSAVQQYELVFATPAAAQQAKTDLAKTKADLAQYQQAYQVLAQKLTEQSAAIADLERQKTEADARRALAEQQAEELARPLRARIASLSKKLAAPTPADASCKQAWGEIRSVGAR